MKISERLPGENARSYAVRILRSNILTLALPPGSIVSENEVSAALQLSRTPVREALIELSRCQLVEVRPQKGSYVSRIDYDLVEESRFLRSVVESEVFRLAAQKPLPDEFFREMQENTEELKRAYAHGDNEGILRLDNAFHEMAYRAAGKSRTFGIIQEQMIHFDRLRSLNIQVDDPENTIRDHEELRYALQKQDPELCAFLLNRHLNRYQLIKAALLERFPEYFVADQN